MLLHQLINALLVFLATELLHEGDRDKSEKDYYRDKNSGPQFRAYLQLFI